MCDDEKIHQCLQGRSILPAVRMVAEDTEKLAKVVKFAGIKAD
jgi:hypothetical protein